uniref:Uncharacterized protein n=1 Tax=Ditylum brightwellii TaxID=49249 RepID=A0A7S4S1U5_9STRA
MYNKRSLLAFFFLWSQATSFAPTNLNSFRSAHTSLNYVEHDSADLGLGNAQPSRTYKLNSNRISELTRASCADDVTAAIKRAQNLKDVDDIRVIGEFLFEGVDDSFAYGYKGSLLARYAVAALRLEDYDSAQKAIKMRKERFSSSMMPFESSGIVRGLLRLHKITEAFELLEDELYVEEGNKDRLKSRALSLASIVSRHFFENEPEIALKACKMLAEMGPVVKEAGLGAEDLDMPWYRILAGADQCSLLNRGSSYDSVVLGTVLEFPLDPNFQEVFKRAAQDKKDS